MIKPIIPLLALLLTILVNGCSTAGYYKQSVIGHLKILWSKQDISTLVSSPNVEPSLKAKLEKALLIRQFGSEHLKLPENNSYRQYTDIGREDVVWNVFAAAEFSITPKTWCYLIVGCVSYRGYYDQAEAETMALQLAHEGYDVSVDGVPAYSTLGWFSDPLLNTVIGWQEDQLARLIFHELSHQIVYIKGDADFNEAFATATETLGTLSWLKSTKPENVNAYLASLERKRQFRTLILDTRDRLIALYQKSLPENEKRRLKQEIFVRMQNDYVGLKTSWKEYSGYDYWFSKPLNNARLSASMTYQNNVPAFYQLFMEANGDWSEYYRRVKAFEDMDTTERSAQITVLRERPLDFNHVVALTN